tara:strand:- start:160 stop:549 length:390 start_codon:yes stop_codon:yes gene_type:complete
MVLDEAIGTSADAICEAYDLQHHEYMAIKSDVSFMAQVANMRKELEKEGVSFRLKAQMQAECYLDKVWELVQSSNTDPKVKAALIKDTVRWAGFDNPVGSGPGGAGGGFQVTINLGAGHTGHTIEGEKV